VDHCTYYLPRHVMPFNPRKLGIKSAWMTRRAISGCTYPKAALIDPQQRMILKVGIDALHGGGMSRSSVHGTNTAVYVGICNNDYEAVLRDQVVEMTLEGVEPGKNCST